MISDCTKIKNNFSRIAFDYERYADIQIKLGDRLLKKFIAQKVYPQNILDIGCGTGRLIADFKKHFPDSNIFGLDISLGMAKIAQHKNLNVLVADACNVPFQDGSFDLVISNVVYQWVSDLKRAFSEARRMLNPEGIFVFSCFGSKTLDEVRSCFNIKENSLPTKELIYENLKIIGFSDIELEREMQYKYFDNLTGILYWLKNIGGNRIYQTPFLTPTKIKSVNEVYQNSYRNNGQVYASFEVIWAEVKNV